MQKTLFKRGLIVGPSGIGAVHLREFLRNGINEIAFIGKSKFKKRSFQINSKKFEFVKIINLKKFKNLKKFRPQITSICSPYHKHLNHILKCKDYSKYIIVEKPFIWSRTKIKKGKNLQISLNLLSKLNNKIVVNLPMVSIARQLFYKKEIPKRIRSFKFSYFTKGPQFYDNIAVDLLPHALSFLLTATKKKKFNLKILAIKRQRSYWSCKIKLDEILCDFKFKQDKFNKESKLYFSLNNNHYKRLQKEIQNEYLTYLIKNGKKKFFLKNPMQEYLYFIFRSFKNSSKVKTNNDLVLKITKITEELLNFK